MLNNKNVFYFLFSRFVYDKFMVNWFYVYMCDFVLFDDLIIEYNVKVLVTRVKTSSIYPNIDHALDIT